MAKAKDYKPPTRAELQAMRESKVSGAAVSEAVRREISFLRNIGGAGDDLEWILFNQAWTDLGFERVGDWWEQRVLPVLVNVDLRPSQALADRVIAAIAADEAGLPPAQRRTQREIASIARTSQSKVARSRRESGDSGSDLDKGRQEADQQPTDQPEHPETAAEGLTLPPADGEHNGDSNAGSSAAGPADFPPAGPAETPQDHRDLDHPGDAAAHEPAGLRGDETEEEEQSPASEPVAQREQQDGAGVSQPAAPAQGREERPAVPVPSWLRAVTAVNAAIYDLRQEDPFTVQLLIPADLNGELGASIAGLVAFYKDMHKDLLDERAGS